MKFYEAILKSCIVGIITCFSCQQSGSFKTLDSVMDIKVQPCFAVINVCVYLVSLEVFKYSSH